MVHPVLTEHVRIDRVLLELLVSAWDELEADDQLAWALRLAEDRPAVALAMLEREVETLRKGLQARQ